MKIKKRGDETQISPQDLPEKEKTPRQRQNAVIYYMVSLFVVVLILILMSYSQQLRRNSAAISDLTEQHSKAQMQALENIEALQDKNMELSSLTAEQEHTIAQLQKELDDLRAQADSDARNAASKLDSVREGMQTTYDALERKYIARGYLLDLYAAITAGDRDGALKAASSLESMTSELSEGEYDLYNSCLDLIPPEQEIEEPEEITEETTEEKTP